MDQRTKKLILVVDDEASYRRTLTVKLKNSGFDVLGAENGEEGFTVATEKHPDLILLDLSMPKVDGITMLRKLRELNDWGKSVPVFLLTALSSADEERNKAVTELEPTYYLEKTEHKIEKVIDLIFDRLGMKNSI